VQKWYDEHLPRDEKLAKQFVVQFVVETRPRLKLSRYGLLLFRLMFAALLTYNDEYTNVVMLQDYWRRGQDDEDMMKYFKISLAILIVPIRFLALSQR